MKGENKIFNLVFLLGASGFRSHFQASFLCFQIL